MVVGPSEDLGLDPWGEGHLNFALQANPSLLEAFRCHFDWLWGKACDIRLPGATEIPELVIPKGSEEAAQTWQLYRDEVRIVQADEDCLKPPAHVVVEPGR